MPKIMQEVLQDLRRQYCNRGLDNILSDLSKLTQIIDLKPTEYLFDIKRMTFQLTISTTSPRYNQIAFAEKAFRTLKEYWTLHCGTIESRENILVTLPEVKEAIDDTSLKSKIKQDIESNGLISPIVYWEDDLGRKIIIDGHDCYEAALSLGIQYSVMPLENTYSLSQAIATRIKLNLNRRMISNHAKAFFIGSYYVDEVNRNSPRFDNVQANVAKEFSISSSTVYLYQKFYKIISKIEAIFPKTGYLFKQAVLSEKIPFGLKSANNISKLNDEDLYKLVSYAVSNSCLPELPDYDYDELVSIPDGRNAIYQGLSASGQLIVKVGNKNLSLPHRKVHKVRDIPRNPSPAIAVSKPVNTLSKESVFPFAQLYSQLERAIANNYLSDEQKTKIFELVKT